MIGMKIKNIIFRQSDSCKTFSGIYCCWFTGGPNCTGGPGTSPCALNIGFLGQPSGGSWFSSTGFTTSLGYRSPVNNIKKTRHEDEFFAISCFCRRYLHLPGQCCRKLARNLI